MTRKPPTPTYTVELRPTPDRTDPQGIRRLRAALKVLLRRFGLRCVGCRESGDSANGAPRSTLRV